MVGELALVAPDALCEGAGVVVVVLERRVGSAPCDLVGPSSSCVSLTNTSKARATARVEDQGTGRGEREEYRMDKAPVQRHGG